MKHQLVEYRLEEDSGAVTRAAARVHERAIEMPKHLKDGAGFAGRSTAVEEQRKHWGVQWPDQPQDVEDLGSAAGETGE